MREYSFFPRLALVNLTRNRRFYGPYLVSCGGTVGMYYVLRFLAGRRRWLRCAARHIFNP